MCDRDVAQALLARNQLTELEQRHPQAPPPA